MQLLSESLKPVVVRMHLAVARDIALAIARGSITVGEALPNDRELSEQYQASRTVIREAIQHLAVPPGARSATRFRNVRIWGPDVGFERCGAGRRARFSERAR